MSIARILGPAVVLAAGLLLASCDTIAQGYINRLPYSVTIVEHPGPTQHPFTLAPGEVTHPGFGRNPTTFDVVARSGRLVAQYRSHDLPVSGDAFYHYVVIDERGAHVETKAAMVGNQSTHEH